MTRIAQPAPDAPASEWTVYADALQEANDPRGLLIALADKPEARDAHVAEHKQALFGPAAEYFDAFRVGWTWCLPETVEIQVSGADGETLVRAFLGSPLARGVRAIAMVGTGSRGRRVDLSAGIAALLAELPDTVRSLAFVDRRAEVSPMLVSRDFEPAENLVTFGSLAGVWKVHGLEEVRIEVADVHQLDLGTIDAPALQTFVLRSLRYGGEEVAPVTAQLAAARWPKLRAFELRLPEEFFANIIADEDAYVPAYAGDEDFEDRMDEAEDGGENVNGTDWTPLRPVLENVTRGPLERLALTSFDSADSMLGVLEAITFPPTLRVLDLSDSSIRESAWFVRNRAKLAGLAELVLEHTPIHGDPKLQTLGPQIRSSEGGGASYRYIVGSE